MSTQALTQTKPNTIAAIPKSVKGMLSSDYFKTQVALCLPRHLTADRFVRVALTAVTRIPKLAQCTPESVVKCMMTCSELGIEPDGRRAHLIPFGTECTLIVDYKGLVELAKRSGDVSNIHAQTVCENDAFDYNTGEVQHKIDFRNDRGAMYAVYAVIKFKDGSKHTEIMTKTEVDRIRNRSRAGKSGPWVTDYEEMAKKTVFRRASKWIVLSPEVQDALDKEDDRLPHTASLVAEIQTIPDEPEALPEPEAPAQIVDLQPEAHPVTDGKKSAQEEIADLVLSNGYTFDVFVSWGVGSGNVRNADEMPDFDSIPHDLARRLLRNKSGLLKGLADTKGAQ